MPQGCHGIDFGGATGGNVAGQHGHGNQAYSHYGKGRRIGGGHARQGHGLAQVHRDITNNAHNLPGLGFIEIDETEKDVLPDRVFI